MTPHERSDAAAAAATQHLAPARPGLAAGTVAQCELLGDAASADVGPSRVYLVRYGSAVAGGCLQAAKLYVPNGKPPEGGWPTSIWVHGMGDPATQLRRWPLVRADWRVTRGELAGRWARHGIATLCPWLPGDGPSEPWGTYSPFSLERNAQALADALTALRNLTAAASPRGEIAGRSPVPPCDLSRVVLRTDCVATPLLAYFAAHWLKQPLAGRIGALVADDFQPSIAYNETYLGPLLCRLPVAQSAAVRCIWWRAIWALFEERGWSLSEAFAPEALELLSQPCETPVGPLPRIMGAVLAPPASSELAGDVVAAVRRDFGARATGRSVRDWAYSPRLRALADQPALREFVRHPFYQRYFAASDPFFAETIEPFAPGVPLFVTPRTGDYRPGAAGLPSFSERFRQMTLPKLRTLREWGWDVSVCPEHHCDGPSFAGGAAQRWLLAKLRESLKGA